VFLNQRAREYKAFKDAGLPVPAWMDPAAGKTATTDPNAGNAPANDPNARVAMRLALMEESA
jgi:hypothetical protein